MQNKSKYHPSYYGKLNVLSLPYSVHHIWLTRNDELSESPSHKWSWQHQTDMSYIDDIDYLKKLIIMSKLTEQEDCALASWVDGAAITDIAFDMNISDARARHIIANALRKLRHYVKFLGKMDY